MTSIYIEFEISDLDIDAIFVKGEPDVNIPDHYEFKSVKYKGVNIMPLLCEQDFDNIQEYLFNNQL